jgi:hypothetical protein
MEPSTHSPEHVPTTGQPEAVHFEPRPFEYGDNKSEQSEKLGGVASGAERYPAAAERQSQPPVVAATPQATLPAPQVSEDAAAPPNDDTPLVAADEDLIEKEWVDKAKKILTETKDDPYEREQRVKKLQLEYVRKRYGREIGDPGD